MKPSSRVLVIALLVVGDGMGVQLRAASPGEAHLADILARVARVANLYRDFALKFECTETIEYRAHEDRQPASGYEKFSYLYERDAKGRFQDCRLWRKSMVHGTKPRCVTPDEYRIPLNLSNAYLWVFAFLEERQPWHEYRIAGEETVLGRPAVIVDYAPRDVVRAGINDWYGRAWIDRENYQLLKVHAYRPGYWGMKQALDRARAATALGRKGAKEYEVEWVVTEFEQEKNGMRFVSEVQLHRARYRWVADYKEERLIDVRQTYDDYRFYRVASREEIGGIFGGASPPAPKR